MARPTKQGIDYFPLDVMQDEKTEPYIIEHGVVGWGVMTSLWCLIYRNDGYYAVNGKHLHLMVKKFLVNVDINEVNVCINSLITNAIFCPNMYQKYNILTSKGVQRRFFEAAKRKKIIYYNSDFLLIGVNEYKNLVNTNINSVNATDMIQQSPKEKEEVKEKEKEEVKEKEKEEVKEKEKEEVKEELEENVNRNPAHTLSILKLQENWNKISGVRRCVEITTPLKETILARTIEHPEPEWWEAYFRIIEASDYLCGKKKGQDWSASLGWVCHEENMAKVKAGHYANKAKASSPAKRNGPGSGGIEELRRGVQVAEEMPPEARVAIDKLLGRSTMPDSLN